MSVSGSSASLRVELVKGRCEATRSGLLLIECLVALGIVLAVGAVAVKVFVSSRTVRESLRLRTKALAVAQAELERLRTVPYSRLPPERHRISNSPGRMIELAQQPVVRESVVVVRGDGQPLNGGFIVSDTGRVVRLSPRDVGAEVLISYDYYARGSLELLETADNERRPQDDAVAVVVSGRFAAENLGGTVDVDTGLKLLKLTAKWLERGDVKELSLTTLRTQGY